MQRKILGTGPSTRDDHIVSFTKKWLSNVENDIDFAHDIFERHTPELQLFPKHALYIRPAGHKVMI
jgi:hypothetical protein